MIKIDLDRIRKALPDRATVKPIKYKGKTPALECTVTPALNEDDFEMCKQWQREIIGDDNIAEFYTEETGHHWYVFLKRKQMTLENTTDEDVLSFAGVNATKIKELLNRGVKDR